MGTKKVVRYCNMYLKITLEGEYEQLLPRHWVLRRWRVGSQFKGTKTAGKWYAVHENQRKDLGALKLHLEAVPDCKPDPFKFWDDRHTNPAVSREET